MNTLRIKFNAHKDIMFSVNNDFAQIEYGDFDASELKDLVKEFSVKLVSVGVPSLDIKQLCAEIGVEYVNTCG
jgi:homospermidine synthase